MAKLSIGFIGAGGIARSHTNALKQIEDVRFASFCDIIEDRAKSYSREYGGTAYTDFSEMLEKEDLDAVYICLPPFAHSNEVELAAERGINVFIQKPIALDMEQARHMVMAVEKAGVKSQVGYQLRFGSGVRMAKRLLDEDGLGQVSMALGRYICNFVGGSWWKDPAKSGGQIVEQSTHAVDLLRYLCGDITRVSSEMDIRYWTEVDDLEIEDVSVTSLRFLSGAVGSMVATTGGYPGKWVLDLSVFTKRAVIDIPQVNAIEINWNDDGAREETHSSQVDLSLEESKHFLGAIKEDGTTITPMSEGAKSLAVTLAIRKSGVENAPQDVPEL
jgi:predicted dehydrogenase